MKTFGKLWIIPVLAGLLLLLSTCEKADPIKSDPGNMVSYRGNNGIVYEFRVTGSLDGSVWGGLDGVYTDDSDLSTAAVHAGILLPAERDVVKVRILPGRDAYFGSVANGVVSSSYGSWVGSYSFEQ